MEKKIDWTAIIFLTSMTKDEELARGIEVGGDDYLLKPVSEIVLQAKVNAMRRLVEMQRSLPCIRQRSRGVTGWWAPSTGRLKKNWPRNIRLTLVQFY